jgi:hypothetical protein
MAFDKKYHLQSQDNKALSYEKFTNLTLKVL